MKVHSLNDKAIKDALDTIGSTLEVFSGRMRRKIQEQQNQVSAAKKNQESRHALMLQTLTTMRRALLDTCKIYLGERFFLKLDVGDWEGWPRISLRLVDRLDPQRCDHALLISAHDRMGLGTILTELKSGEILGRLLLVHEDELDRLQLVLKTSVRRFLDVITPSVLNPAESTEVLEAQQQVIQLDDQEAVKANAVAQADVFSEDIEDRNKIVPVSDVTPVDDAV